MKIQNRIILVIIGLIFFSKGANSQTTIASEDFENTLSLFTSSGSGAFYSGISGVNDRPAGVPFSSLNNYSFGVTNGDAAITSNSIDVSGYTTVQMSFKLAAFSIGNTASGLDNIDQVAISISPDGGANYYLTSIVRGNSNAYWSYSGGTANASTPYDGDLSVVNFSPAAGGERTTDGYSTVTITSLPQVSNLRFRISFHNDFSAERWIVDDFKVTGIPVVGPLINVYPFSLTGFNSIAGIPSSEKTYEVKGSNLTDNITINAGTDFQVSTTTGTGFSSSLVLTQAGGIVPLTTIYVRMNAAASGAKSGTIANVSSGATTKNIAVSGTVLATEPTIPSTVSFTNITGNSMGVNFTGGNGAGRIVVMKMGTPITNVPIDGTDYSANNIFGIGSSIGTGQYVVYKGTGTTVNVVALNANTTYYVAVFEYNDDGIIIARNYYNVPGIGNASTLVLNEGLELFTTNSIYTIDFDNTVPRVNNGAFTGSSLNTSPITGQLNSNAWSISGENYGGPSIFGGSSNAGGGISTGSVNTGTYYAFETTPGNRTLGINPTDDYWTPGYITLKLQNKTGSTIDSLAIAYKLYVLNNGNSANGFYFDYSTDNITYYTGNLADTSIAIADASPEWKVYLRSLIIRGLSLPNESNLYIRWKGDLNIISGVSDEFAIDDIKLVANPTTVYPRLAGNFENIVIKSTIQLNGNTNVIGNITLLSGNIELENNSLTIGGNANGSSNGYILTNGTGSVTINNITTIRLFPIGTITYNPLTVNNGSNLNWTVKLNTGIINPQLPLNSNEAVLRTWTVTPSVNPPTSGATLSFSYNDGDPSQLATGFNNNIDVLIWHYDGINWSSVSSAIKPSGSPGGNRSVTLNNWSQFSSFVIANITGVLPIKFSSVKAEEENNGIKVSWSNLTETNVSFYSVERSYDAINFSPVTKIVATENNGNLAKYNWLDNNTLLGNVFYRIVAVENDGHKVYSQIIKINIEKANPQFRIYPNPAKLNSQAYLSILNFPKGDYLITTTILNGQTISKERISHNGGSATLPFECSTLLKSGVYIISIEGGKITFKVKLVIQ